MLSYTVASRITLCDASPSSSESIVDDRYRELAGRYGRSAAAFGTTRTSAEAGLYATRSLGDFAAVSFQNPGESNPSRHSPRSSVRTDFVSIETTAPRRRVVDYRAYANGNFSPDCYLSPLEADPELSSNPHAGWFHDCRQRGSLACSGSAETIFRNGRNDRRRLSVPIDDVCVVGVESDRQFVAVGNRGKSEDDPPTVPPTVDADGFAEIRWSRRSPSAGFAPRTARAHPAARRR